MSSKSKSVNINTNDQNLYVVAIGASAGGLEALERFFSACPSDTGLVYVVIQHLSPDHKSMMSDLLARYTQMPISLVEDGMTLEADHVYLIPAGTLMRVVNRRFVLTRKSPHVFTLPIDIFFTSLSENYGVHAIGVILSGTGSDGTRGAYAINEAGGFLLAQEPASAKFDGMPNSVIGTGLVDEVLPAEELSERILSYTKNPSKKSLPVSASASDRPFNEEEALEMIFKLLMQIGGIDFHDYKLATVSRRIERRMQVKHISGLEDYALCLEQDRAELLSLRRELLIPVTSFFRDTAAFEDLAKTAIKDIVSTVVAGEGIRVWTAGTSTGEEVYSIAMLFLEAFEREKRWPSLKIFATDVNPLVIEYAAAGQYPESVAAEMSAERLERFFVKTGSFYTVKPELRQCIVFARHNILVDPPFTRMDLVTCRNMLIYFKSDAQLRAMHRLQYALKKDAFLFLGSSESISGVSKGFSTLSAKNKIFRRTALDLPFMLNGSPSELSRYSPPSLKQKKTTDVRLFKDVSLVDQSTANLLTAYVPPSMLVNDRHEALHLFGNVNPYFRMREGSASMEINRILPDSLVAIVSALLFKSMKDRVILYSDLVHVNLSDNTSKLLRVCVRPVLIESDERYALLVFEEEQLQVVGLIEPVNIDEATAARLDLLQQELAATRESLQATIEELETSNEELQATNEELMASNEELQSSNEELQSVNEEMNTVNAEYQEKVSTLNQVNADLDTMAKAVGVATIFVDHELTLTRFTPDAVSLFKLRETDVGRPLNDIRHLLKEQNLTEHFEKTLMTGLSFEKELSSEDGRIYLLRILPYRVPSSERSGAVATFVDVTAIHDHRRLQDIMDALPEHIAVLAPDGTIALVNAAWRRFARANGDPDLFNTGVGSNYLLSSCPVKEDNKEPSAIEACKGVKGVLEGSLPFYSLRYPCHSPTEKRWFVMNVSPISGHHEYGAVVSHNNISSWYQEVDA
jgi:two-component system CheB/CheR fusion protein